MGGIRAIAIVLSLGAACADEAADAESTGTTAATTDGGAITLEDCDEIVQQTECEAALPPVGGLSGCAWIEVRRPGATCNDPTTVSQCMGFTSVGPGCQGFECSGGTEWIDAFVRTMDGMTEVFASPECGLVPVEAEWTHCSEQDGAPECACLCGL